MNDPEHYEISDRITVLHFIRNNRIQPDAKVRVPIRRMDILILTKSATIPVSMAPIA